ncbi:SHIRT domain-containing protein [Parvimonas sp. C2]|uniref:SHIRT domain-containing protein n=1 Tax=Parvimonas sp. C2 TaxID=3110692 RepID=UPI002B47DA6C|nr:SHIRT domain-containing protein [Parvimonas sp. C2]MEB3073535.1 SHIRT domain-containing protein [Parvimonas sp. C2]
MKKSVKAMLLLASIMSASVATVAVNTSHAVYAEYENPTDDFLNDLYTLKIDVQDIKPETEEQGKKKANLLVDIEKLTNQVMLVRNNMKDYEDQIKKDFDGLAQRAFDLKMGIEKLKEENNKSKFKVKYRFVAVPDERELPEEVKAKLPKDKSDVEKGTKIAIQKYDDVKVDGGTWKFINWKIPKDNQMVAVENEVTVENEDLFLTGEWKFVKDGQEQPNPQAYRWVQNENGKWSYQSADGKDKVKDSWKFINNEWYLFDKDGYMIADNWVKENGKWYYLEASGSMSKNEWVYKDGNWYYANASGRISQNEWVLVDGNWYYANASGRIAANEWFMIGGKWYYAEDDGQIAQGKTLKINNVNYTFDGNGVWIR